MHLQPFAPRWDRGRAAAGLTSWHVWYQLMTSRTIRVMKPTQNMRLFDLVNKQLLGHQVERCGKPERDHASEAGC